MAKILVVDDEAAQREMLAGFLKKKGYQVLTAAGGMAAAAEYPEFFSPLAVIDLKMPDMNGLELLTRLREINPFIQVIVLTAFGTVETAVEAMQRRVRVPDQTRQPRRASDQPQKGRRSKPPYHGKRPSQPNGGRSRRNAQYDRRFGNHDDSPIVDNPGCALGLVGPADWPFRVR